MVLTIVFIGNDKQCRLWRKAVLVWNAAAGDYQPK